MKINVVLALDFEREAKKLRKRYPNLMRDLSPLLSQLEQGETPGDRIQGLAPYRVYQARIKNSDSQRGKSGGYRVIYYLEMEEQIAVLTIYSKSDQNDLPVEIIRRIIDEYEG
jgi:mRNA-degrading endonuclease RelE of RelBE toxin-antitoxin system